MSNSKMCPKCGYEYPKDKDVDFWEGLVLVAMLSAFVVALGLLLVLT